MFLGEFTHTLDNKGRLTIPAKFRDNFMAGLVVTRNPSEQCLLALPRTEWDRIASRVNELPMMDARSGLLRRALFSAAEDLKPDRQGRVLVSQRLRDYATIESEVVIAGMYTFIELWSPEAWDTKVMQQLEQNDLSSELFAALNV